MSAAKDGFDKPTPRKLPTGEFRWTENLLLRTLGADTLRGEDLAGEDLRGADLIGADLRGAVLTYANMSGANLRGAFMTLANLRGAVLTYANMRVADLTFANMTAANLTGANLRLADMTDATGVTPAMLAEGKNVEHAILPEGITMEDIKAARAALSKPPAAHPEPEL